MAIDDKTHRPDQRGEEEENAGAKQIEIEVGLIMPGYLLISGGGVELQEEMVYLDIMRIG